MKNRFSGRFDASLPGMAFLLALALAALVLCLVPLEALAAEEGHEGWGLWEPIGRWFNLLLLGGFIAFLLRKPLKAFFAGRRQSIRDELRTSAEAYEKALADKKALEEKVRHIDDDLARIREEAKKEAEADRERVRLQTAKDAERLLENARREIENLTRSAQKQLREYAAELTVDVAEKKVRAEIKPQDERRVEEAFFTSLGEKRQG